MKLPFPLAVSTLLICTAAASGGTLYTATPLGTLGDGFTVGSAINHSGQITGESRNSNGFLHAFLYSNGVLADLGVLPGGVASTGLGINNSGQITGYASTAGPAANHAFLYSNGNLADLGTLGGMTSFGRGINDSGQITGYAVLGGVDRAFLYANGVMTPILSAESQGTAINASGQITGQFAAASGFFHAFVYSNGITSDLGTLGGPGSFANGINACGQVTGYSSVSGGSNHAFLYSDGKMVDLGTLGGTVSVGLGINDAGQIVGASLVAGGPNHAFLYSNGEMIDLNSVVINSLSDFILTNATGINNIGQIVATGLNSVSHEEAFMLTPVREPGSGTRMVAVGVLRGEHVRPCRHEREHGGGHPYVEP